MTKEDIYDNEISPLMVKVIEICKSGGIAMIANFEIPNNEDDGLQATSLVPDEYEKHSKHHRDALHCIHPSSWPELVPIMAAPLESKTLTTIL